MSVLKKATLALDCLGASGGPLRLHQVAAAVGLPRSSTHRLLGELAGLGIVHRVGEAYILGPRLTYWGTIAAESFDLRVYAEAPMRRLRDLLGESVHLYVAHGGERICVAAVESNLSLRPFVALGQPMELGVGSSGKLLLAFSSEARRRSVLADLERDEVPYRATPDELDEMREQHWAVSVGERADGVVAAATTVRGPDGGVTAVMTVSGPSSRLTREKLESFRSEMTTCAREITTVLTAAADTSKE